LRVAERSAEQVAHHVRLRATAKPPFFRTHRAGTSAADSDDSARHVCRHQLASAVFTRQRRRHAAPLPVREMTPPRRRFIILSKDAIMRLFLRYHYVKHANSAALYDMPNALCRAMSMRGRDDRFQQRQHRYRQQIETVIFMPPPPF
jgi:hypothetical protein